MGQHLVFDIKNISKSFGNNHVLKGISLGIEKGEVIGMIGSSGAGKTTLLNLLVGFLAPEKGVVHFTEWDANGHPRIFNVLKKPMIVNKNYGFAAQTPSFYEKLTVRENLEYFGKMYNLGSKSIRANVDILLKLMGLKASQYVTARDLSGGMKRRLDMACAMVHNPAVLILDEPTADLDPVLRNQIWEIVKRINMRGTTVILSSHHLNELDSLCNRIAILKDGHLVDIDTPDKLKLKYTRMQEILIESYPGSYEKIIPQMKGQDITGISQEGTYLTIRTEQPEKIIRKVLTLLERSGEQLLDIKLNKPNLDDVFVTIYGKKTKKKQKATPAEPKKEGDL
ncbi:ABC transporter ATP-binding protein [Candidatus Woesearchaeota archaeon]|nr:ABC transporter ATP-binding protein [Candidatus Woesearchaeota archaeon]